MMKRVKYLSSCIFISLILLAILLRIINFGSIPNGINRDEAAIGYNAFLLLNTGMDEHHQKFPLRFQSFGDWKLPLYIYLAIPFIWTMGLSAVSVRIVSLVFSILLIIFAAYLTKKLWLSTLPNYSLCLSSMFFAFNPWHFHFSHLALEAMVAASLFTGAYLFLHLSNKYFQIFGHLLLIVTLYTYHASLIFVPLWLMSYLFFNWRVVKKSNFQLLGTICFLIIFFLSMYQAWNSPERLKVTGTSIFSLTPFEQWEKIYQYRNQTITSKLIHNQYIYFSQQLLNNYVQAFSPQFLLIKGGNHPHYNFNGIGNFLVIEIVLAAIGVVMIMVYRHRPGYLLIVSLFLSPLPGAITKDGVHSTRNIFMMPIILILATLGLLFLLKSIKTKSTQVIIMGITIIAMLLQVIPYQHYYQTQYKADSNIAFTGYMESICKYLSANPKISQFVTFPFESPYIFYAFYNKLDPNQFLSSIEYYPTDDLGFSYAKTLLNMQYIPSVKNLYNLDSHQLIQSLIYARVGEVKNTSPIQSFRNSFGKPEINCYQGESLISSK